MKRPGEGSSGSSTIAGGFFFAANLCCNDV
jgi:hypothetical protein